MFSVVYALTYKKGRSFVVRNSQDIVRNWFNWNLTTFCSNLYKADTSLKRTNSASPVGVRFREVLLYPYGLFGTKRHPPPASSGSAPPLCHTFLRVLTLKSGVLTSGRDVIENKWCRQSRRNAATKLMCVMCRCITGPRGKFGGPANPEIAITYKKTRSICKEGDRMCRPNG